MNFQILNILEHPRAIRKFECVVKFGQIFYLLTYLLYITLLMTAIVLVQIQISNFFFLKNLLNLQLHVRIGESIVISILILNKFSPQNNRRNLSFVEDFNVLGKKWLGISIYFFQLCKFYIVLVKYKEFLLNNVSFIHVLAEVILLSVFFIQKLQNL